MAGKLIFTPEDFQKAAITYRKELLMMPILGLKDVLQYCTSRPGIRYAERVGEISGNAQVAPYNPNRKNDFDLKLNYRTLETFFGSVVEKFEPNSAVSTILGSSITKGDGQMSTPTAQQVLTLIARSVSNSLFNKFWTAKRNASGDTTADLFNGFDTIAEEEIQAGNISEDKGNYLKITEEITPMNAVDIAKKILFSLHPLLRAQECNLYCSQDFLDKYNEGYLLTHAGIPYNMDYGQQSVEGSGGRLKFVALANKADSKFMQVSPQSNMLVGFDQMGDSESVMVKEYEPFVLTYIATMFFGQQYESINPEKLKVVELAN